MIIVIDALRYDFTVPFVPSDTDRDPRYYHNAFPVLYDTASKTPENAFLLPFIADPPTTTVQRLKGLTTGSLPTIMDAGSNFAAIAIEEDNLLSQMRSLGKTIVHLGDDTWHSLFPGYFQEDLSHAYDSFNVRDLHTVDNGVISHLLPLLAPQNSTDWDFIIAHFLGVDHAGHHYGPDHPAMQDKLQQMNGVILRAMEMLDQNAVLVVMGDHGMDTKGDHGGESDEEVEAALWMYATRPAFGRMHTDFITPPSNAKIRPVRQTDLVSTLSLLLGLPIPFNNLGAPIEEAFTQGRRPNWRTLVEVNRLAVAQIQRYQEEYSKARDLGVDTDQQVFDGEVFSMLESDGAASSDDHGRFERAYLALRKYESSVLSLYRRLWVNFKLGDMARGVIVLTASLVHLLCFSTSKPGLDTRRIASAATFCLLGGSSVAIVLNVVLGSESGLISDALLGAFSLFLLLPARHKLVYPGSLWSWLSFFFTISQAAGFASNSYTIHEDSILLFFLTTFGVISCISSLRQADTADRYLGTVHAVLFTVLTRLASFSRYCREEQMPGCRSTFYASSATSTSAPWQIFLPFVIAIFLPTFIKARYKGTASYVGPAPFWLGFCFRIGLLLVAAYWMLDAADNGRWLAGVISSETLRRISLAMSRCVIGIATVVGLLTIIWTNPCIDVVVARQKPNEDAGDDKAQTKPAVAILGYANMHGTRYFLLLPVLVLLITVLFPPMGQFAMAICASQILCLMEILDSNALTVYNTAASSSSNPSHNTLIGPVILAMLGSFHFFKTGHQATLASIQWGAAFVPLRTLVYPWSPLLVVLNTFGPQILCAAAVPLTVLWKRPVKDRDQSGMRVLLRDVRMAILSHMSYYAVIQLATTMWAGHLRRHLMLYRVFMPRFLVATGLLVVIDVVLLVVAWSIFRVNTLGVIEVVGV